MNAYFTEEGSVEAVNARMGQRDDDIGAGFLHHRHPGLGGLDDVAGLRLAFEVLGIPGHDLRRDETDETDLDRVGRAGTILDLLFNDHIRLEEQIVLFGKFLSLIKRPHLM